MTSEAGRCPVCEARADITRTKQRTHDTVSCWDCGTFKVATESDFKEIAVEIRRARLADAKRQAAPGDVPELKP
jgi:hypothetical protein